MNVRQGNNIFLPSSFLIFYMNVNKFDMNKLTFLLLHEHLKVNDMEAFYDNDHFVPCTPPSVDGTTIHKINHSRRK